ncbi:hypothetical protein CHARACLAT_030658 [Characodon lateralis]|uniref:Uncharacterized protein n=1 Tax=Characodon lateralis TaxID=208331 RepID=A0ABU7D4Y5_9TELE|nr:hypothetical protein [Characodon lateralis]
MSLKGSKCAEKGACTTKKGKTHQYGVESKICYFKLLQERIGFIDLRKHTSKQILLHQNKSPALGMIQRSHVPKSEVRSCRTSISFHQNVICYSEKSCFG